MGKTLITERAGLAGNNLARLVKPSVLFDWRELGFLFENDGSDLVFEDCYFIHGDIRNGKDLKKCLDYEEIGSIIHLAATTRIKKCKKTVKINLKLLKYSWHHK